MPYTAPTTEQRFVLDVIADLPGLAALPAYANATPDMVDAILAESGKLASGVFAPLNKSGDKAHAQEERGDVLFTRVNVARCCGIDPEAGLAGTNRRFLDRFARVEAALGGDLTGRSISELEGHWRTAKAQIRAEAGEG